LQPSLYLTPEAGKTRPRRKIGVSENPLLFFSFSREKRAFSKGFSETLWSKSNAL
jgi:hypothetical protein